MRFIRRRLVAIAVVAFIVIFGQIGLANTIAKNQELIQPAITITEEFKDIPYNPGTPQQKNNIPINPNSLEQKPINDFAWQDFLALNWPIDCQGKPLESIDPLSGKKYPKIIGQAPEAPRVWELYPSPKDVFLPNGATPPLLKDIPEVERCLNDRAGSEIEYNQQLRLTETEVLAKTEDFGEVKTANQANLLDGYGELKVGISLADIDAANQIPLVDRQGNYVINEIRLNPVEFEQIRDNKWYDATNLNSFKQPNINKQFQLVCSQGYEKQSSGYCDAYKEEGAIEIKVVWRVFDERNSPEEKTNYYTTKRKIVRKNVNKYETLQEAELGLIGFHIMHKTSQLGWVWSTFEHIDNAPSCALNQEANYTLYNKDCIAGKGNCNQNLPYVKQPYLWQISNQKPKAVTLEGTTVMDQIPSQICRANPISKSTTEQNKQWQNSLRAIAESSVWQYYQLVGTQWLQHPELPYSQISGSRRNITPLKPPLTNVALEPYAQGVSCIICHTSASLPGKGSSCQLMARQDEKDKIKACADFSFLIDNAQPSQQTSAERN